jgi:hypothetical protein
LVSVTRLYRDARPREHKKEITTITPLFLFWERKLNNYFHQEKKYIYISINVRVNVKFPLEQATKAQRVSKGIALIFL